MVIIAIRSLRPPSTIKIELKVFLAIESSSQAAFEGSKKLTPINTPATSSAHMCASVVSSQILIGHNPALFIGGRSSCAHEFPYFDVVFVAVSLHAAGDVHAPGSHGRYRLGDVFGG